MRSRRRDGRLARSGRRSRRGGQLLAGHHGPGALFLRRVNSCNLSYDPSHNIAYIRLREESAEVETLRISDELNIDLAPDGTVYGIELLNANAQL
jgi:uncharacterized protein YuzE